MPTTQLATPPHRLLPAVEWRTLEAAHEARADALTEAHRTRKLRGEKHPVEDFLWTYYSVKPGELRRWHPGAGARLAGAVDRAEWRYYRLNETAQHDTQHDALHHTPDAAEPDALTEVSAYAEVDAAAFFAKRAATVDYVDDLLRRTLERTPRFGCFGLHEWAMVYRLRPEQTRHTSLDLRIGHAATDQVVESHPISCSHFDAYRFFTPAAAPLNELRPARETQAEFEQSGCLHAGMDVYKWAAKLGPLVPGAVLLDAFELARDIREVDMRASPYDVSAFTGANGAQLDAIPIETPRGKRAYADLQREFAARGNRLRERVIAAIAVARLALETH